MSRLIVSNIETQNIKFDSDTTAMSVNSSGVVSFNTAQTGVVNYVNGLTGSGSVTLFDTNFSGAALNGGAKTIKIFISQLVNSSNGYMHFRTIDANGTTDGGYGSSFSYNTGSTFNQNSGSGDANQANAMAVGYYANTYNIMIDCQLVDPSTNRWVFFGFCNSLSTSTANSGFSIAYNALGADNPITGFRFQSTNSNGFDVSNMKYGYSYTT